MADVKDFEVTTDGFRNSISIIVCTYNPNEKMFSRVLKAIESLKIPEGMGIECVIVDNNSTEPIEKMVCVENLMQTCNYVRVITEQKQGLAYARIAGVQASTAPIIIFIDDDNEPTQDYIEAVKYCLETHPCVSVWGPGKVSVEFLEPVSDWFARNFQKAFQERDCQYTEYGSVAGRWTDFYPFGTGMILKREVFDKYYEATADGRLSATDRKGDSLSSGGDIQIVWEAIKMGFAAGVSPRLRLTHLIPEKRCNLKYIKRVVFGCASSYAPALVESFPEKRNEILGDIPSNKRIVKNILTISWHHISKLKHRILPVALAEYLGSVSGLLRVAEPNNRQWVYKFVKLLNLD